MNGNHNHNQNKLLKFYYTAARPEYDIPFLLCLLLGEIVLSYLIVTYVRYTEIDWKTYMQQVQTWWIHGEVNYRNIYGDTGPLVYPAGFLYLFTLLRYWTTTTTITTTTTTTVTTTAEDGRHDEHDHDNNNDEDDHTSIRRAQCIFAIFYVLTQAVVLCIFTKSVRIMRTRMQQQQQQQQQRGNASIATTTTTTTTAHRIWSWRIAMGCLCLSKRLHSIFMLRLFNDGPTMLLLYTSIWLFMHNDDHNRWKKVGCLVFSLAVSLKMNVLLFAPGLLLLLLQTSPDLPTVIQQLVVYCALPQLILGAPFLMTYPASYLRKAFELDRVFFYKWTVNWKFLPEDIFVSKSLSLLLLGLHLGALAALAVQWLDCAKQQTGRRIFWNQQHRKNINSSSSTRQQQQQQPPLLRPCPLYVVYTLLVSNFIGIAFARTLHYQFYAWYFHAVPYLLWFHDTTTAVAAAAGSSDKENAAAVAVMKLPFQLLVRIGILLGIETAFLTFPATAWSSALLQVCHLAVLWQIRPPKVIVEQAGVVDSEKKTR